MIYAKSFRELEFMLLTLKEELLKIGLEMHESKSKILTSFNEDHLDFVDINSLLIEILPQDKGHRYLGRMIASSDSHGNIELASRVRTAWGKFHKHRRWLTNRQVPVQLRLKLFDAVVSPAALFALSTVPLTSALISQLGIAQRKMLRSIVGWVRLPSDDWADTMRRMRQRLDRASRLHFVAPWEIRLKQEQWKYAQHLANLRADSWQSLVVQWQPANTIDPSIFYNPHRKRGRPRVR